MKSINIASNSEHVPIIAVHGPTRDEKTSPLTKARLPKPTPELTWAQQERYKERTMSERVNARLKDEFEPARSASPAAAKVMAHLMYGVLALTVDQWMKLADHKT
ncbi:MAG: hypothetical protein M9913_05165 [Bryobacteraceae bacterium]|nr:hypothetical protein [Bryobacteraceae bacterium]